MPKPLIALLAAVLVAFGVSYFSDHIDPYYLDVLIGVGINVILAVSLNLVNGYTGQFSLGHAGFMSVGAYLSAAVTLFLGPRLLGASGALGLNGIPNYTTVFWVYSFAALTVFTVVCLVRSTYGRGFIATHDDEVASEAVGLNTTRYKIVAFVVGAFFAGVAGGLYGHFKLTITPTGFDFTKSIEIVVMVILGGMGNTPGVILAAILLTLLPEVLRAVDQYRMVLYSLLLIVLMLVRPKGLFNFDYSAIATRLARKLRPARN